MSATTLVTTTTVLFTKYSTRDPTNDRTSDRTTARAAIVGDNRAISCIVSSSSTGDATCTRLRGGDTSNRCNSVGGFAFTKIRLLNTGRNVCTCGVNCNASSGDRGADNGPCCYIYCGCSPRLYSATCFYVSTVANGLLFSKCVNS